MPADYGNPPHLVPCGKSHNFSVVTIHMAEPMVKCSGEMYRMYICRMWICCPASAWPPLPPPARHCWDEGDPDSFQIYLYSFVWLSSAIVLVLERAGVATAAAAQRMRGPPQPVGLGTERQHMFLASFLLPLPSFFLWLPPSLSQTPPHNPKPLFIPGALSHLWTIHETGGWLDRAEIKVAGELRVPKGWHSTSHHFHLV